MNESTIDFSSVAQKDLSEKILLICNELYGVIKTVPLFKRNSFPKILRNNNFATILRVTNTHAFLEITGKLQAKTEKDRVKSYKKIFTSAGTHEKAMFEIAGRNIRIGGMTAVGSHAFRIGRDCSMCTWDLNFKSNDLDKGEYLNILYVVGFGEEIPKEDAWQEFDSLIRITFKDWSDTK